MVGAYFKFKQKFDSLCYRPSRQINLKQSNSDTSERRCTLLKNILSLDCSVNSTTHCADKLPRCGCKQIKIHTDCIRIIDFLRLKVIWSTVKAYIGYLFDN